VLSGVAYRSGFDTVSLCECDLYDLCGTQGNVYSVVYTINSVSSQGRCTVPCQQRRRLSTSLEPSALKASISARSRSWEALSSSCLRDSTWLVLFCCCKLLPSQLHSWSLPLKNFSSVILQIALEYLTQYVKSLLYIIRWRWF